MNARKYCSTKCRLNHYKKITKISIRKCAWCGNEFVALHDVHRSKFCCKKHAYFSKLQSNLESVRKYQKTYTKPTRQAWLGNSNLKAHPNTMDWNEELKQIQNEFKRLKIKRMYK